MSPSVGQGVRCAVLTATAWMAGSSPAAVIHNLTGLPTYPHLDKSAMDDTWHTENLGRWCARFTAVTGDSLDAVSEWYRRHLKSASETDLARDRRFGEITGLAGIKLAVGASYVALYRLPNQPTVIELHRCGGG